MKKKNYIIIGIIIILILIGINVNNSKKSEDTIKIGVIVPLTGPLAEYGIAFQNGILLAKDELKADSKNIEFIFEDSQYDPKKSVSAFYKLRDTDQVDLIVDWGVATCEADAPLVKEKPIPYIAVSIDTKVTKNSPYIIRFNYSPEEFSKKTLEYLRNKNYKKIGILKSQLYYMNMIYQEVLDQKNPDEKITLIDNVQTSETDFRSSLLKIKNSDIDILGVFLIGGQINQFYKQAKENNINITTFGTDFFESKPEIEASNGLMNGIVFANMDVSDEFIIKYNNKFKTNSQLGYAGGAYDITYMLLKKVNYKDKDTVINSLKNIKGFNGVVGNISYSESNEDRGFLIPVILKKINNNGEIVKYTI